MKKITALLSHCIKGKLIPELVSIVYYIGLHLLGATWKIKVVRDIETLEIIKSNGSVLYAFWHSRILPLSYTHRGRGITVLISEHMDGELIARSVRKLGFNVVRGSATRGGVKGIKGMVEMANCGHPLAITPDGPRGPARKVKYGAIAIAKLARIPIIPVGVDARRKWTLKSWDGFIIPKPFTKIGVVFGEPMDFNNIDPKKAEELLETEINHMNELASKIAND